MTDLCEQGPRIAIQDKSSREPPSDDDSAACMRSKMVIFNPASDIRFRNLNIPLSGYIAFGSSFTISVTTKLIYPLDK